MRIIALQGNSRSGKSLTIKTVAALIMKDYNIQKAKNYNNGSYTDLKDLQDRIQYEYAQIQNNVQKRIVKNIRIIIEIKGKTIGICSAGDTAHDLVLALDAFCKEKCEIGIVAVHYHSFGAYEHESGPVYLEQIEKCCDKLNIDYVDKKLSNNPNNVGDVRKGNDKQAQELLDKIKKLI